MRIKTAHVRHLAFLSHARKVQGWLQELACAIPVRRKPATAPAFLSLEFLQQSERCLPGLLVTTAKGDKHLEVIFEALCFRQATKVEHLLVHSRPLYNKITHQAYSS